MAKKTNYEKNGVKYYRIVREVGRKPDGTPIRKEFYGDSKSNAEAKYEEFKEGLKQGLNVNYKEVQLGDLMHDWLFQVARKELAAPSFDRYESVYRNYVKPSPFNIMKVYDVRPLHLKKHYNEMIAEGKTDNMVFNMNKLLKKFFFFCMEERYITINPCSRLTLPKSENKIEKLSDDDDDDRTDEDFTVEVDPFTDEEIEKIKKALKGNTLAVFMLGLATGMRRGELLGLTVGNVDIDNNLVKVRKALKRIKLFADNETYTYEVVLDGLKTKNSRRDVPIPTTTQAFFKRYIRSQRELFFKFGKSFESSSFFFTTEGCRYIDGKNFLTAWTRGLKRAGVRYRKFHNVRHTYATRLFENGVQLKTVSMLLGHANISITADVYVHVMPKEKDNAVENLNYMFM